MVTRMQQARLYNGTCSDSTIWAICLSQRVTSKFTNKLNIMSRRHSDDDDNNNSNRGKVSLSVP